MATAALACATTISAVPLAGAAIGATNHSASAGSKVIVFLKAAPAGSLHANFVSGAQGQLASLARSMGARVVATTAVPGTMTLVASPDAQAALAANANVAAVVPDGAIPGPSSPTTSLGARRATTLAAHDSSSICGTASAPELGPQAITAINAPAGWTAGGDGAGVTVAYLADGIDPSNPDFQRNAAYASTGSAAGSPVITSSEDFSGDGTTAATAGGEAFLDASSIAAQPNTTYDLSNYVNAAHPLPTGCDIKLVGAAPGASIMALKVFAQTNSTTGDGFIQAISYAVTHGVKVINESFGNNGFPDDAADIVRLADDAAVAAGVTVVVSSGDAGISSTIGSPASDPNVIAVGASTTFQAYAQGTEGGINAPSIGNGTWVDNGISSLSSSGYAQDGKTVDLVAPGDENWALCSASSTFSDCGGQNLELSGGTSEASPLTAGAAADVIQAYASTHGGVDPTPAVVKEILTSSATDLGAPTNQQGAGLLNIGAAVALAKVYPGVKKAKTGAGLLISAAQQNLLGVPGASATTSLKLSNTATTAKTWTLSTRTLHNTGSVTGSVTMDPSVSSSQPTFPIWSGYQETYQTAHFTVPAGTNHLSFTAAWANTGQSSLLHVALFNPSGAYAGYSEPQGLGDYSDVEEANPTPGTWTAVFFTVSNADGPKDIGTSGVVPWSAGFSSFVADGTVTPSKVTLKPGASTSVKVKTTFASNPGDSSFSFVANDGTTTTLPFTVRTEVPTTYGNSSFSDVLTGGNGRAGAPAQTNTYDFVVPKGEPSVNFSLAMSSLNGAGKLPGDQVVGYLVDPDGQVQAYDTNYTYSNEGATVTPYLDLYDANPAAGMWQVVLEWANPVTGADLSVPYKGEVNLGFTWAYFSTLPDSAQSTVSASSGGRYKVQFTNSGLAPMNIFLDPRTNTNTTVTLSDFTGKPATNGLPNTFLSYLIPTDTSSVTVAQSSTVPATFDFGNYNGDPDLSPQVPSSGVSESYGPESSSLTYAPSTGVSAGPWGVTAAEVGPFPTSGEPSGSATDTVTVTTKAPDAAISDPTGDYVFDAADLLSGNVNVVTLDPGQGVTIPVAINPTASVGSTVSGTLYVDQLSVGYLTGGIIGTNPEISQAVAVPYEYTVGS